MDKALLGIFHINRSREGVMNLGNTIRKTAVRSQNPAYDKVK